MKSYNDKSAFYAVLVFLIWPLLGLISAFKNYRSRWAKNVLWAFIAFYGFAFAISSESENSDIVRYVKEYQDLHKVEMTVVSAENYFKESGEIDVAQSIIAIVLSRLTDKQSILMLVYGGIFGFFFSRNMWFVLSHIKGKVKPITIILFACFFLVVPIWNINGFRFWTASHMFIYGVLPYLFEGNKKGLFLCIMTVLVHFAFIVPVGILLGYLLVGNRLTPFFIFFMVSFFFSQINLTVFNNAIESYAPEIVQERTSSYRSAEKVEDFRKGAVKKDKVWYAVWYNRALGWSVMGFLVVLFFKGRPFFMENKRWLSLFSFTLLYSGMANFLSSIPSGGRYRSIALLLALPLIILYIQNQKQETVMERFVWAAIPALLLFIVVSTRIGLYSMSATAVLGNPVIAFFLDGENISLNDVMKMVL